MGSFSDSDRGSERTVTLELGSNEAIKEAVRRGVGGAVLSVHAVHKELEAGRLFALPVKDSHCDRDMYVLQDRRSMFSLPAREFLTDLDEPRPHARIISGAYTLSAAYYLESLTPLPPAV